VLDRSNLEAAVSLLSPHIDRISPVGWKHFDVVRYNVRIKTTTLGAASCDFDKHNGARRRRIDAGRLEPRDEEIKGE
jgi:hypothetical protein